MQFANEPMSQVARDETVASETPNPKLQTPNPNSAFALTCPLITKSDGGKFGKTESGTIWLDAARTSPYQFYQFWLKLPDADAARMAYIFSFKPVAEIRSLIEAHEAAPHQRALQKALAEEMTILVHSEEDLRFAQQASQILFGGSAVEALRSLNEQQLLEVMEGVPQVHAPKTILDAGLDLISFLAEQKIFPSKGEARKMVAAGGVSINKEKITATDFMLRPELLLNGRYLLVQKGKSNYTLAVFE
jgi:tyrosyl-tRNA synthetase